MRHFFLSYSPGDDDLYVGRFFLDLSRAVRRLLGDGSSEREVGFLDHGVANDRWPSEIRNELSTCQTLVVLCSPKLFLDERCGRVWTVFSDRLRAYHSATGQGAPALITVPWSTRDLPVATDGDDGVAVATPPAPAEDLRVLIRLHSYRHVYEDFVAQLARRVVDTARSHRIPQAPPGVDLRTAKNAFESWQHGMRGPQYVHFVVAAGTRDQMRVVRQDLGFYGERQEDWAPFHPALAQSLAARAREIAAERLFGSDVVPISAIGDEVGLAHERNEIVVVLLDSWVIGMESFRRVLAAFDQVEESAVAVLVPASRDDAETRERRDELKVSVLRAFPHCARRRDTLLRTEIETPGRFDDDLAAALEEAQNRIFAKGRIFRRPADGPANARPILEGP